eukprot:CAMPEP_0118941076 /NCGR_PEP_ID=MMETSP1169-20130426/33011_1 /TAXON_ID=36882 /ORGANISM="Pyramimonas obovata, Strain CCMP722" /LENGTH=331 /DNA_ID=CAMNT_0006885741 /DNA_START=510 /DNA_END=1501 /DNA_ORIENTATION=-
MEGHANLSVGILVFWVFVCFYALGVAADKFFCPSLERIAAFLQLAPDVAGATLLSFGNSAPDVFTQIAAARTEGNRDLPLAISAVGGAGMFITTIVLAAIILCAPEVVQVAPRSFIRDAGFYLFAVVAMLLVLVDGTVYLFEGLFLAAVYLAYILFTIFGERYFRSHQPRQRLVLDEDVQMPGSPLRRIVPDPEGQGLEARLLNPASNSEASDEVAAGRRGSMEYVDEEAHLARLALTPHVQGEGFVAEDGIVHESMLPGALDQGTLAEHMMLHNARTVTKTLLRSFWREVREDWEGMSQMERALCPVTIPVQVLMRLTMPEVGEESNYGV